MRRRHPPERPIGFSHFQAFAFGSDAELVAAFGSLDAAATEWGRVRDEFLAEWDLWGRPQAWWRFEPGVPDDLRTGPPQILTNADGDAWRSLEQARRRYLVSVGIDPIP